MQFFWEKPTKKSRTRFNLLLLEYGEIFLEDISVYHFPHVPSNWNDQHHVDKCESLKQQGRLKICSKSLIFEPAEKRLPILRFPFKSIVGNLSEPNPRLRHDVFTFTFKNYIEMKANDRIGPYKSVDCNKDDYDSNSLSNGHICIVLVHSELQSVINKIDLLRRAFNAQESSQYAVADSIMKPLLSKASIIKFDSSVLVDFHEELLLTQPIPVKKVKPLVTNPGGFMLTKLRVYFQPSQLNNLGDSFQYFELNKVERIYCRRYLLQQIGLEFILNDGSSTLFIFDNHEIRDFVYDLLQKTTVHIGGTATARLLGQNKSLEFITRQWQRKEITNFEYLVGVVRVEFYRFNESSYSPIANLLLITIDVS